MNSITETFMKQAIVLMMEHYCLLSFDVECVEMLDKLTKATLCCHGIVLANLCNIPASLRRSYQKVTECFKSLLQSLR